MVGIDAQDMRIPTMIYARRSTQSSPPRAAPGSGCGLGKSQRLALLLVVVLAMSLAPAVPCRAGLVIVAPTLTQVAPGSSGSFDVLLMDTDPSGSTGYNVSESNVELTLSGPPGFTFTDATINTGATYIYVQSTDAALGVPLSPNTFPNTDFIATDAEFASPFFRTVNPGDVFGLARVFYTVAPTTFGTATITIADLGVGTTLTDINGIVFPITAVNGSISTISTIPEPTTLIQGATALLIGLGAVWLRRHP